MNLFGSGKYFITYLFPTSFKFLTEWSVIRWRYFHREFWEFSELYWRVYADRYKYNYNNGSHTLSTVSRRGEKSVLKIRFVSNFPLTSCHYYLCFIDTIKSLTCKFRQFSQIAIVVSSDEFLGARLHYLLHRLRKRLFESSRPFKKYTKFWFGKLPTKRLQ